MALKCFWACEFIYSDLKAFSDSKGNSINRHSIRTCIKCGIQYKLMSIESVYTLNDFDKWERIK